jgi:hypothetical protein
MKQVTYAGTSFVTGSAIADSLLALVAALGVTSGTASVKVPALDDNNDITSVDLVIGPASEVVAIGVTTSAPEIIDADIVRDLDDRVRALAHPRAVASSDDLDRVWDVPDLDVT